MKAASSYSQALELQAASPATEAGWVERYELLDQRANCYRLLSDPAKMIPDLEAMAQIAEKLGDVSRQVQVMLYQAVLSVSQSKVDEALQIGEKALQLSRQAGDKKRIADSLETLGRGYNLVSNYSLARDCAEQALSIYQELEDLNGEANVLYVLARLLPKLGQMAQAQTCAQRAIDIFRQTGNREGEGNILNEMGLYSADSARRRDYFEQAAVIFEETGNRSRLMTMDNNLGVIYDELGLYGRAIEYERRAVDMARNNIAPRQLTFSLDSLARIYLDAGDYPQARQYYEEGLELAKGSGIPTLLAFYNGGLGLLALKLGDPAQARQRFQKSVQLCSEAALPEQAGALAWLGAACLALGDLPAALQFSGQAVAVLRGAENYSGEYPPQDIWWWRYRVLTTKTLPGGGVVDEASECNISFEAWDALDRARTAMLSRVASLSDEGLRRNYFNKKEINRQIIQEWFKHAARRGVALALLFDQLAGQGDLPGQLKRMLEIGVRLNARRDAAELPHF
ncbi:MAG: tetratricopeptide repeat protein, partial [Kiritimatiellota bacterium]|nr:tetratricopeptide repeat protein [Kiritimatiellota bacterium]